MSLQLELPFGPVVNRNFLSNNWLEQRLPIEPEWTELRAASRDAAAKLIALWQREKTRVERYGDEAGLEEKFIQPILEILGWSLKYQTYLHGREPDYALFDEEAALDRALQEGRNNPDFWLHASMVADAKAWHINLDRPEKIGSKREYPPEQIEWYLDRSRCNFGILTNGRHWRLVPRNIDGTRPRFQTYLQVDLPSLIEKIALPEAELQLGVHGDDLDLFMRFFLLFSVNGFRSVDGRHPLIVRAVEGSSEYALSVSEELKERVFEALRLTVEGLLANADNKLSPERDLVVCQEQSFVFLYRLLFILFAEDRGFLPYKRDDIYTRNRSLARFRNEVAAKIDLIDRGLDRKGFSRTEYNLWKELKSLFEIVDSGHKRYQVPAYNGGLFSIDDHPFLESVSISDHYVARILDQLSRALRRDDPHLGLFKVDYRDLAIQQLGSVYEGLLELRPRVAAEDMVVVRSRSTTDPDLIVSKSSTPPSGYLRTETVYPKGSVYLETDKGERRSFGTYYTPDHIVNHMVEASLGPLCRDIEREIERELSALRAESGAGNEARVAEVAGSFDDRVLALRILDPAMGSGHFLIRACQYLAEEIATNPFTQDLDAESFQGEATILHWKRKVAERCLYGVDLNPMAVELAKLALWLETVAIDAPLAFLDHHLQTGDSLIGARLSNLDSLPNQALESGVFKKEIETAIPTLLNPLIEIQKLPSDSIEDVKRKEQLYKRRYAVVRERFERVADTWCAAAIGILPTGTSSADYEGLVKSLSAKAKDKDLHPLAESAKNALGGLGIRCFHWELAFPEVFLTGQNIGFDAIIGNPPYDVLSEKESGHRVSYLKTFVDHDQSLRASKVGKNNLYKLFICRSVALTRRGGILSLIVPMPLLGDEQAKGVRTLLLGSGHFSEIHSFPQKDNPKKRVFKDAKLSTAIFVLRKFDAPAGKAFSSFRHPANVIDFKSPKLELSTDEIPLYDPSNLTIVSCAQDDWDLAVRIAQRPGIRRLGAFCKSYQGEVNETTDAKYLFKSSEGRTKLVLRGANLCRYCVREASQGTPLYLDLGSFEAGKASSGKLAHTKVDRIGFQRSAPQNNYRRIIAAPIPAGEYCFDTVSYVPREHLCLLDHDFLLGLLNSALSDWYFTLGSTNSKVNEYQFNNLPCPIFREASRDKLRKSAGEIVLAMRRSPDAARERVDSLIEQTPFDPVLEDLVILLVRQIREIETARGEIARTQRAHLAENALKYQSLLDYAFFRMAGLSAHEIENLGRRPSMN